MTTPNPTHTPTPTITVKVDPTNPGQFFACCGLLELAQRLWPGAEGWFTPDGSKFYIACAGILSELVLQITRAELIHNVPSDIYSSPITIGKPFFPLCVDWWETDRTGAKDLKVWAGTMESYGIAHAMRFALRNERFHTPDLFDEGLVVVNPEDVSKKKEPYYFDARRANNAHARDIGFSTNDLSLTTIAFPAVEFLCLIGLQVARPSSTNRARIYDYYIWPSPLPTNLLLAASSGKLDIPYTRGFRFENWFRTGQKKHKAFRTAIPVPAKEVD